MWEPDPRTSDYESEFESPLVRLEMYGAGMKYIRSCFSPVRYDVGTTSESFLLK
jgi:hypothetical protein